MFILSVSKRFTSGFHSLPIEVAEMTFESSPGAVGKVYGWALLDLSEQEALTFTRKCQEHCSLYRVELFSEEGVRLLRGDASGMRAAKGFSTPSAGVPSKIRDIPIFTKESLKDQLERHQLGMRSAGLSNYTFSLEECD